jgi:hypothetical protein
VKYLFCLISFHNWVYKREKHPIKNHPSGRENVRVLIRECKWCGHREQHMLPRENKRLSDWKKCCFDENSPVEFQNL